MRAKLYRKITPNQVELCATGALHTFIRVKIMSGLLLRSLVSNQPNSCRVKSTRREAFAELAELKLAPANANGRNSGVVFQPRIILAGWLLQLVVGRATAPSRECRKVSLITGNMTQRPHSCCFLPARSRKARGSTSDDFKKRCGEKSLNTLLFFY